MKLKEILGCFCLPFVRILFSWFVYHDHMQQNITCGNPKLETDPEGNAMPLKKEKGKKR